MSRQYFRESKNLLWFCDVVKKGYTVSNRRNQMHYLVIYTHPKNESLNASIRDSVLAHLAGKNSPVKVIDLYADAYDPVLRPDTRKSLSRTPPTPRTEEYRQLLREAHTIICIHPTWWGRPPAIFLGFCDQVFGAGFAYEKSRNTPLPKPLLRGKHAYVITTLGGPPIVSRLFSGDAHRILLKRLLFAFCGIHPAQFLEVYSAEKMTAARFARLEKKIGRFIR